MDTIKNDWFYIHIQKTINFFVVVGDSIVLIITNLILCDHEVHSHDPEYLLKMEMKKPGAQ